MTAHPLPPSRRHDLDWIRVLAFGLLILYHVGMYYVSWDWHVKSPFAGSALEPLMIAASPWRLSLLFLVSGAATGFLLARPGHFLGPRSWRLLLPLAFGMLVLVPPQSYYEVVEKLGYGDGYLAFWGRYLRADGGFCREGDCLILPTWNHLWFVAYLWVYTVLLWAAHRLLPAALARAGGWCRDLLARRWGCCCGRRCCWQWRGSRWSAASSPPTRWWTTGTTTRSTCRCSCWAIGSRAPTRCGSDCATCAGPRSHSRSPDTPS